MLGRRARERIDSAKRKVADPDAPVFTRTLRPYRKVLPLERISYIDPWTGQHQLFDSYESRDAYLRALGRPIPAHVPAPLAMRPSGFGRAGMGAQAMRLHGTQVDPNVLAQAITASMRETMVPFLTDIARQVSGATVQTDTPTPVVGNTNTISSLATANPSAAAPPTRAQVAQTQQANAAMQAAMAATFPAVAAAQATMLANVQNLPNAPPALQPASALEAFDETGIGSNEAPTARNPFPMQNAPSRPSPAARLPVATRPPPPVAKPAIPTGPTAAAPPITFSQAPTVAAPPPPRVAGAPSATAASSTPTAPAPTSVQTPSAAPPASTLPTGVTAPAAGVPTTAPLPVVGMVGDSPQHTQFVTARAESDRAEGELQEGMQHFDLLRSTNQQREKLLQFAQSLHTATSSLPTTAQSTVGGLLEGLADKLNNAAEEPYEDLSSDQCNKLLEAGSRVINDMDALMGLLSGANASLREAVSGGTSLTTFAGINGQFLNILDKLVQAASDLATKSTAPVNMTNEATNLKSTLSVLSPTILNMSGDQTLASKARDALRKDTIPRLKAAQTAVATAKQARLSNFSRNTYAKAYENALFIIDGALNSITSATDQISQTTDHRVSISTGDTAAIIQQVKKTDADIDVYTRNAITNQGPMLQTGPFTVPAPTLTFAQIASSAQARAAAQESISEQNSAMKFRNTLNGPQGQIIPAFGYDTIAQPGFGLMDGLSFAPGALAPTQYQLAMDPDAPGQAKNERFEQAQMSSEHLANMQALQAIREASMITQNEGMLTIIAYYINNTRMLETADAVTITAFREQFSARQVPAIVRASMDCGNVLRPWLKGLNAEDQSVLATILDNLDNKSGTLTEHWSPLLSIDDEVLKKMRSILTRLSEQDQADMGWWSNAYGGFPASADIVKRQLASICLLEEAANTFQRQIGSGIYNMDVTSTGPDDEAATDIDVISKKLTVAKPFPPTITVKPPNTALSKAYKERDAEFKARLEALTGATGMDVDMESRALYGTEGTSLPPTMVKNKDVNPPTPADPYPSYTHSMITAPIKSDAAPMAPAADTMLQASRAHIPPITNSATASAGATSSAIADQRGAYGGQGAAALRSAVASDIRPELMAAAAAAAAATAAAAAPVVPTIPAAAAAAAATPAAPASAAPTVRDKPQEIITDADLEERPTDHTNPMLAKTLETFHATEKAGTSISYGKPVQPPPSKIRSEDFAPLNRASKKPQNGTRIDEGQLDKLKGVLTAAADGTSPINYPFALLAAAAFCGPTFAHLIGVRDSDTVLNQIRAPMSSQSSYFARTKNFLANNTVIPIIYMKSGAVRFALDSDTATMSELPDDEDETAVVVVEEDAGDKGKKRPA